MGQLFGALGIADSERPFTSVQGQQIIWEETQRVFERWNQDFQAASTLFVEATTDSHKERYELPGGGTLEEEDESTGANVTASVKRTGKWDVAYPLRSFGSAISFEDVGLAYLTMGQYEKTVQTVLNKNNNTMFSLILKALFTKDNTTYTDKVFGALTCVPLANGDSVVYPPVHGSTVEATENFYIGTSYAESAISNTNNPFVTLRDKIEPHYGYPQGGSPIIALVNTSTVQYARRLAGFDEYTPNYVKPGDNISTLRDLPGLPAGMRIVGVDGVANVVIVEWPRMPAGWIIGRHLQSAAPLKRRVDLKETKLAPGLQLITKTVGQPYETSRWRNRQGFGVGNRLGAVVIGLTGDGNYAVPSAYQ